MLCPVPRITCSTLSISLIVACNLAAKVKTSSPDLASQVKNWWTFCGQKVHQFFTCEAKSGEDVFTFAARLQATIREIERVEHVILGTGQSIKIPEFLVTQKLMSAATTAGAFTVYIDRLLLAEPEEWIRLTPDDLLKELKKV